MNDVLSTPSRIAVALSGGVDSAVVAALLKEQGADVVTLTMLLQKDDRPDDAVRVAQSLGLEHHIIDLTDLFAREVMADFADIYAKGETPIPCVTCNRLIKFGALMDAAKQHGAQALATGHYARRVETPMGAQLHRGDDQNKDQSYFLFALSQEQIDFLRFPLGERTKEETRNIAARHALPVAQKKDSQDICFVPCGDYVSVLEKLKPDALLAGHIVDQAGNVLGSHKGIVHFTVGQRKGLNLSDRVGDNNEPLFVIGLNAEKRQVIVGPREALAKTEVILRDVNWLAGGPAPDYMPVSVRLRSAQQPQQARFSLQGDRGLLRLAQPAFGVAPGQAGVIYQGSRVLGGGWISNRQTDALSRV